MSTQDRVFAFSPPIVNIEYNEWRIRETTGYELCVVNARCDLEIRIPMRLLGEASGADDPVMTVELKEPLEYKSGKVGPLRRRVLEMPEPRSQANS